MELNRKKYDANFTAGGLLFREFTSIASILTSNNFIDQIHEESKLNLFLGIQTESARKRVISEIKRRYEIVDESFWKWFSNNREKEQKLALFYVCLKTYSIVLDLHLEVAVKKYRTGSNLDSYSIQMRIHELVAINEEMGDWSTSTLDKINSQYRTTLKDCGLLNGETLIPQSNISDLFWGYFEDIEQGWFKEMCFK
jgi:hypothetical protein